MDTISDSLVGEVEAFLVETGMSATRFGTEAVGTPSFVFRLRKGADVRASTIDNVRRYMRNKREEAA